MTILLFILKMIGIVFLIVFVTLLVLLSLLLFCPIRYKLNEANNKLTYNADVDVSWMIFVVRIIATINNDSKTYCIRLFGHSILQYPPKEKKVKKKKAKKRRYKKKVKQKKTQKETEENTLSVLEKKQIQTIYDIEEDIKEDTKDHTLQEEAERFHASENYSDDPISMEDDPKKMETSYIEQKGKIPVLDKIKQLFQKVLQKIKQSVLKIKKIEKRLRKSFINAKDKAVFLKHKYDEIMIQIHDENNKKAVKHLWKEIRYLLKHFRPRKVSANVQFATTDPALTGQITGGICLFPYLYAYDMHIIPDFEADEFYLNSNMNVKGHIRLIHVLCVAIRVLLDKNIMKWVKKIL